MHLAIHLLNQQLIYFNDTTFIAAFYKQMNKAQFTLMIFFDYNAHNLNGQQYLYQKFSAHYVYDKPHSQWKSH